MRRLAIAVAVRVAASLMLAVVMSPGAAAAGTPPGVSRLRFGVPSRAESVVALADGRIVVASRLFDPAAPGTFAVSRLSANGLPDRSFGRAGSVLVTPRAAEDGTALHAGVDRGGRITVADGGPSGTEFVRLLADGSVDRAFAQFGRLDDATMSVTADAVAADGTVTAVGTQALVAPTDATSPVVARFLPDGTPDPAFGTDGHQTVAQNGRGVLSAGAAPSDAASGNGRALLVSPTGVTVVLADVRGPGSPGSCGPSPCGEQRQSVLFELDPTGRLVAGFGSGGAGYAVGEARDPSSCQCAIVLHGVALLRTETGFLATVNDGEPQVHPRLISFSGTGALLDVSPPVLGVGPAAGAAQPGPAVAVTLDGPRASFGVLPAGLASPRPPEVLAGRATSIAVTPAGGLLVGAVDDPTTVDLPLTGTRGTAEVVRFLPDGRVDRTFAACLVPPLAGLGTVGAGRRLRAAHCRLGRVRRRSHARRRGRRGGSLRVTGQRPAAGTPEPLGAPVDVTVAVAVAASR